MFKGFLFFVKEGWKYDKFYVLWRVLYQFVNAPLPIFAALLPKLVIDELMGQKRLSYLTVCIAVIAGYTLISSAVSVYFNNDSFTRRCRVNAEFDSDLHRRLYECDYENLESPQFLNMQEKAKKFLYCNWHGFGYLLDCALNICGHLITLIGIGAIVATLNVWIILLFIVISVLGAWVDSRVKKKVKSFDDALIANQRGWTYFAGLFEKAEYGKEFRIYQMGTWLLQKERAFFTRANDIIKKSNDEYTKSGVVTAFFTFVQQIAAYGYLIYSVLANEISIGDFTMYVSAITAFATSFRQIMSALVDIRAHDFYYKDLDAYLSVPANLRSGSICDITPPYVIAFQNVSFRYPGSDRYALHDVSLTLTPGEKLLIVGENGAGKTTFVKLLLRLYDPTDGEILLNGINIKSIDYETYLSLFSSAFQDYNLFSFSLRDNITMGKSADDVKIESILRNVGFGEKLAKLPNGLDTAVYKLFDETGFEPSGGEGQKLAIARALYKDTPFLILDEPTAALDPRAEYEIYQQINTLLSEKTAVFISHRLSSAKYADTIAVFEDGRITEYGTHEALLDKGGTYAELFEKQASFYRS